MTKYKSEKYNRALGRRQIANTTNYRKSNTNVTKYIRTKYKCDKNQKDKKTSVTIYKNTKWKYEIRQEDKKTNMTKYNQVLTRQNTKK